MFTAAGSKQDAAEPRFLIEEAVPSAIPLQVLEGPKRSLGHIDLERLTACGEGAGFFLLGAALIALARASSATGTEAVAVAALDRTPRGRIATVCLRAWPDDRSQRLPELRRGAAVVVGKVGAWIAPYMDAGVAEGELATVGVLRRLPAGMDPGAPVACDGTSIYLAAPATGCLRLGKLLAAFAIQNAEAMQLESSLASAGVARQSYELECLKPSSFAARALFGP
jgi:hypothetical protein